MLLDLRGVNIPVWDPDNPAVVAAWRNAAEAFARGAKGDVRVVLGDTLRPGNVWETVELPALRANTSVRRIIRLDPTTGAETVIFRR